MNESELVAMTVNERLFSLGLLDEFDAAAAAGDIDRVEHLLQRAHVDQASIDDIAKTIACAPPQAGRPRVARAR